MMCQKPTFGEVSDLTNFTKHFVQIHDGNFTLVNENDRILVLITSKSNW